MSVNCFFGTEVKPDGTPFTPVMPPQSSLIITQCAVTTVVPPSGSVSEQYGAVTLYVQSHDVPARMAVCTLSPSQHLTYSPLQLVFSKNVTFSLVPRPAPPGSAAAGKTLCYPTVHLTGYYEHEEEEEDEDEDEVMDFAQDEDDEQDDEEAEQARSPPRRRTRRERQNR